MAHEALYGTVNRWYTWGCARTVHVNLGDDIYWDVLEGDNIHVMSPRMPDRELAEFLNTLEEEADRVHGDPSLLT